MTDLLGHREVLERLIGTPSFPALLFSGPEGLGKRLVALRYAAHLNCLSSSPGEGCVCLSCRKIQGGNHPDLVMVERPAGKLSLGVAEAREIIAQLSYRPYEGRCRVCIVTEADRLTDEAQSALLKTLEEPPPGNVLILVTAQPSRLLPTVVSRCRSQAFQPIAQGELENYLIRQGSSPEASRRWARLSQGCPGRALRGLRDPALAEAMGKVHELLGGLKGQNLWGILSRAQQLDGMRLPELEGRAATEEVLRLCESFFRDLLLARAGLPGCGPELEQRAQAWEWKELQRALEAVQESRLQLHSNVGTKLLLQSLCLRVTGLV